MRDLAVDMVGDVSLRDTVGAGSSDPGHDRPEVAKEVTIISRQGSTGESELASPIVRDEGVGVLQESDQHEPVIDPGNKVSLKSQTGRNQTTHQR